MRRADPHRALLRVLLERYPGLQIVRSDSEPWASATFTGARHRLTCMGSANIGNIGEAELQLPGHIVADIVAASDGDNFQIEALTVEVD